MLRFRIRLFIIFLFCSNFISGQIYPLALELRVDESKVVVKATLKDQISYWDENKTGIFTLNIFDVEAYLSGYSSNPQIAVITDGGIIGNQAQKTFPETEFKPGKNYLLFAKNQDHIFDNKQVRNKSPNLPQMRVAARIQGAIPQQNQMYYDVLNETPKKESALFQKIEKLVHQPARRPSGEIYSAVDNSKIVIGRMSVSITSLEKSTGAAASFKAGTIDASEEMIIKGSGFEAARGSGFVAFSYSGSAPGSYVQPSIASDYISWSDTEIRVKVPDQAGTGNVWVRNNSGTEDFEAYTVDWGVASITSSFDGWGSLHRNRVELIDDNSSGGYTFQYSSVGGFSTNSDAQAAFSNAISTWRCNSGVNYEISGSATAAGVAADGINSISFGTLSSGTLGIATSRYEANSNAGCKTVNTFWRTNEIDLQFNSSTNWYYGVGSCSSGQYDFETIALHETGHLHGLTHIVDNTATMHYIIGECNSSSNIRRTLNGNESNAASHKMSHSTAANCISSPSPMTAVGVGACALPLPVELISFSGKPAGKFVELYWETASEIENRGFEVQRKILDRNWKKIGYVEGSETSFSSNRYKFTDKMPSSGINFYRLKQIDLDGNFELTNTVSIEFSADQNQLVQIYPNPIADDLLNINFSDKSENQSFLKIFNTIGQKVLSLKLEKSQNSIDLKELRPGIYFIEIERGNSIFSKRILLN